MATCQVTYEDGTKEIVEVDAPNQRDAITLAKKYAERHPAQGGRGVAVKEVKFLKT